ncbi:MAG: ABC transporter ATP-binding protein [Provencibacterium sp.]|jgi:ABC-2 type transport system ATP-binding protein|nr:ABC transporter ATP-binding protein [Provencibacterium sp.]
MEEVIRVEDVWMLFNLSRKREERVKEYVIDMLKGQLFFDKFWALKGVGFRLEQGDSMGIVGLNGSGKSTLLKLIAGIMEPTVGRVYTKGLIAPLLELGGGFSGNMTARENVFLSGSMHGLSRRHLLDKYEEIVEFSELGPFMDVPVRNFSSGMRSRLGFALATTIHPNILILDEVLAVGDAKFRSKAMARMQGIINSGATLLFVSHSIDQVAKLCNKALWLDHGHVRMLGSAKDVCAKYKAFCAQKT